MEKWKFCGLIVALGCLLIITPVAACHADLSKTGDSEACTNEDYTYTITATLKDANNWYVKVVDTLPNGATYVSSSPSGSYNSGAGTVTWIFGPVAQNVPTELKVKVRFANPGIYYNSVNSEVSSIPSPYRWEGPIQKINVVTTTVDTCEQQVPEFPTLALPVGMVLGFAFIVYSVRSRKEE